MSASDKHTFKQVFSDGTAATLVIDLATFPPGIECDLNMRDHTELAAEYEAWRDTILTTLQDSMTQRQQVAYGKKVLAAMLRGDETQ